MKTWMTPAEFAKHRNKTLLFIKGAIARRRIVGVTQDPVSKKWLISSDAKIIDTSGNEIK